MRTLMASDPPQGSTRLDAWLYRAAVALIPSLCPLVPEADLLRLWLSGKLNTVQVPHAVRAAARWEDLLAALRRGTVPADAEVFGSRPELRTVADQLAVR